MEFSINSPIIFLIVGIIILFVVAQSVFFLIQAYRRGLAIGMEKATLNRTIRNSAIFTIAPAIGIFVGVITLSAKLGIPLPWLRLSVIGSLTYELAAAEAAAGAVGSSLDDPGLVLTAQQYVTITTVMTLGIVVGLILVPILCKKIQGGMVKIQNKDATWGEILMTALFMGMISAFLGLIICDLGFVNDSGAINFHIDLVYWIPVFVMIVSAVVMLICGALMKLFNWKWLNDYALPLSMVLAMASALPITAWIGG